MSAYISWNVKCLECGNELSGSHPWENNKVAPVSCARCGKYQVVYPEHRELSLLWDDPDILAALGPDFDTPNEPNKHLNPKKYHHYLSTSSARGPKV